mgnify:CR=1 FL=1
MITSVEITKEFQTGGSLPIQVLGSDGMEYVCKYCNPSGFGPVKEWLASRFLNLWKIPTPEVRLVKVDAGQLSKTSRLQPRFFEFPCFGSRYLENAEHFSQITFTSESVDYSALLKIALFDIWMSNEDRNHNNANLLVVQQKKKMAFYAIDHTMCFNSGNLDKDLYVISQEETLIYHPIFDDYRPSADLIPKMRKRYEICVGECYTNLKPILKELPEEWVSSKIDLFTLLTGRLFAETWRETAFEAFESYLAEKK